MGTFHCAATTRPQVRSERAEFLPYEIDFRAKLAANGNGHSLFDGLEQRLYQICTCLPDKRLPLNVIRNLDRHFDAQLVNLIDEIFERLGRCEKQAIELDDVRLQRAHQGKINGTSSKTAEGDAVAALPVTDDSPREVIHVFQSVGIEFEHDLLGGKPASAENPFEREAMVGRHAHHVAPVHLEEKRAAKRVGEVVEGVQSSHQTIDVDEFLVIRWKNEDSIRADRVTGTQAIHAQGRRMSKNALGSGGGDGKKN